MCGRSRSHSNFCCVFAVLLLLTLLQLALAWCAKNPCVSTVITGATRVEQITENMKALAIIPKLTDDIMSRINAITEPAIVKE